MQYQRSRASSPFASVGSHSSRITASNASSLRPITSWVSCTNSTSRLLYESNDRLAVDLAEVGQRHLRGERDPLGFLDPSNASVAPRDELVGTHPVTHHE